MAEDMATEDRAGTPEERDRSTSGVAVRAWLGRHRGLVQAAVDGLALG